MTPERLRRLRDLGDDEAARAHRRHRDRLGIGPSSRCVRAVEVRCIDPGAADVLRTARPPRDQIDHIATRDVWWCGEPSPLLWCFPGWRGNPVYGWTCDTTRLSARVPALYDGPLYSTRAMRRLAITSCAVRCAVGQT